MRRLIFIPLLAACLIGVSAHQNLLMSASTSQNLGISVTNGTTGASSCPDDDGSAGGPGGTPQLPNLLDGYAATINGPHGLGCKVAGVDYAVGITAGTILKDPTTTALPPGCSLSNDTVTCTADNTVVDGYDFGLHGTQLVIGNVNNVTISNNNFIDAANDSNGSSLVLGDFYGNGATGNVIVTKNRFGYNGSSIIVGNGAVLTVTYNLYKGGWADDLDLIGAYTSPSVSSRLAIKYNLWWGPKGLSVNSGGHPDGVQYTVGNWSNPVYSHNTYYNPSPGWDQPYHVESQLENGTTQFSRITNPVVSFNTMVQPGSTCTNALGYCGNYTLACKQDDGSITNYSAYGNYIDATLIANHWTPSPANLYGCTTTSYGTPYDNYDMVAGTPRPASAPFYY